MPPSPRGSTLLGRMLGLTVALPLAWTAAAARADQTRGGLQLGGSIVLNAQIEAGLFVDPLDAHHGGENFGQLFTDHGNQVQLNQVMLTLHRDLDPKSADLQWGLGLQGIYGSDARYTHFLGELDTTIGQRNQLDLIEADVLLHLPVLSPGGLDLKVGEFLTPLGYEPIDPAGNPFYSHSYIFNFALPFKHTGLLAVWHATALVDLTLGIDTGANTTFRRGFGDNNGAAAGMAGVQLNLLGGRLTLVLLTHIGPENPSTTVTNADAYLRFYNDAFLTYKPGGRWSFVTETDWVHDDYGIAGTGADAAGVAQYAAYRLTDSVTLNARGEIFRDDKGYFVAAFPGNLDYVNAELGRANGSISVGPATYGELTLGLTWQPADLPKPIAGLMLRPEVRLDQSLTAARPYQGLRNPSSITLATDLILQF